MNILCLFVRHPYPGSGNLSKDFSDTMHALGHNVSVVTLQEKNRQSDATCLTVEDGYEVLRVKSGKLFDTNKYRKFITLISLPRLLKKSIKRYFSYKRFNLIITHTPYMANGRLVRYLKSKYKCPALLFLWDIFPQNAIDLKMIKANSLLHRYLKYKEVQMFEAFEYISCMSKGNRSYLLTHYPYLRGAHIMVNYHWAKITPRPDVDKRKVREIYGYNLDDKVCVFGGNFGKPQSIEQVIFLAEQSPEIKFLFIGKGTEFNYLQAKTEYLGNVKIISFLDNHKYLEVISACDLGLISLNQNFTIPNFPSRTIDYLKCGLPIFAILDDCAASDYGEWLVENDIGQYIYAKNIKNKYKAVINILNKSDKMVVMQKSAHQFFLEKMDVTNIAQSILKTVSYNHCQEKA